jgi:hypothetical protein
MMPSRISRSRRRGHRNRNARTWSEVVEQDFAVLEKVVREMSTALGLFRPLQADREALAEWVARTPPGTEREIVVDVATNRLWRDYPNLHAREFLPEGLAAEDVFWALWAAIEDGWPAFERSLRAAAWQRHARQHGLIHGGVFLIRWEAEEPRERRLLPPQALRPVIVEYIPVDETLIKPGTLEVYAAAPLTPTTADWVFEEAINRSKEAARKLEQRVIEAAREHLERMQPRLADAEALAGPAARRSRGRPVHRGRRRGRPMEYGKMMAAYLEYCERGSPENVGQGLGGDRAHKQRLERALRWLECVKDALDRE